MLYLLPVSSTSSGDSKTWKPISLENHSRPPTCIPRPNAKRGAGATNVRGSTFDLLEALAIDPVDNDRTPTQSIRNMDPDVESVSENVEQLIRETDEAFKAVGTALAEAKAAAQAWHDDRTLGTVIRKVSVSRGAFKKEPRPPVTPVKSPITRTKSAAKGKRKTFYRKKPNLLSRVRHVPPPAANTPARWTLTDVTSNVVDIFNGKIFRTEVDEMLTPDRLRRLRQEERTENERRISADSARSVETDDSTPTEPFHLESLSSRITAAQLKEGKLPPLPSPVLPPPATPSRHRSPTRHGVKAGKTRAPDTGVTKSVMEFQELNFPSPPKIPTRSNARGTPSPLPTIPEVSPLDFIPRPSLYSKPKNRQFSYESIQPPPKYIFLPSTSFTLKSPFRQGEIRIERKVKELFPDEELDWTAFQMAISGTMDEIGVDERDDIEWAADEAEVDDILKWWAGYRFQGYGRMIQGGESRLQKRKPQVVALREEKMRPRGDSGTDKIVVESSIQARPVRWMKEYAESLPPSPMLDLSPPNLNKEDGVIPMGYNLGHDLGDFLDWETHYVRKYFVDD